MIAFIHLLFNKPKSTELPITVKGYDPKDYPSSVVGPVRTQPRSTLTLRWTETPSATFMGKRPMLPVLITDKNGNSISKDWTISSSSNMGIKNETAH